jgi:hypothetical protein
MTATGFVSTMNEKRRTGRKGTSPMPSPVNVVAVIAAPVIAVERVETAARIGDNIEGVLNEVIVREHVILAVRLDLHGPAVSLDAIAAEAQPVDAFRMNRSRVLAKEIVFDDGVRHVLQQEAVGGRSPVPSEAVAGHLYVSRIHHRDSGSVLLERVAGVNRAVRKHEVEPVSDVLPADVVADRGGLRELEVDAVAMADDHVVVHERALDVPEMDAIAG